MNKGIYTVINEGNSLLANRYFNDSMFLIWLDYSRKMLDLVCQDPIIKYKYSSFIMQVVDSQGNPSDKLKKCIYFLMTLAQLI